MSDNNPTIENTPRSRKCFYYVDGQDTGGRDVMKIQCFCGTTACKQLPEKKPSEVCMCCMNTQCDYSTVGCPWYVGRGRLNSLLEMIA